MIVERGVEPWLYTVGGGWRLELSHGQRAIGSGHSGVVKEGLLDENRATWWVQQRFS